MTWTRGRRELCAFSGRLPLEQGAAFEQAIWSIAKPQRALDKQAGTILEWQQSAAVGLSTCAAYSGDQNLSLWSFPRVVVALFGRCRPSTTLRLTENIRCTRPAPVPQPRRNRRVNQRDLRELHRGAGGPAPLEPARGRSGDRTGTLRRLPNVSEGPRPPNRAKSPSAEPKQRVLASCIRSAVERQTGAATTSRDQRQRRTAHSPPTNHTHHPATSPGVTAAISRLEQGTRASCAGTNHHDPEPEQVMESSPTTGTGPTWRRSPRS